MTGAESNPKTLTATERLTRRYIERAEKGDDVIFERIRSTLLLDSSTHPTEEVIREYVTFLQKNHARRSK